MRILPHSAETCKKWGPSRYFNIGFVAKYQKNERGTLWNHLKVLEKNSLSVPKN